MLPIFLKEEDQANEYDLSYDEIILFQLKMIDYISKHQTTKIICLIELPYLSKEINDYLINMKNCFIVAMFYKTNSVLNIKDTYIFDDLIYSEQIQKKDFILPPFSHISGILSILKNLNFAY